MTAASLGEMSKFPFCDHKQTTKDDKRRLLSSCDPDLSVGSRRRYVRGHIWWLGLKYVSSQRAFCGLYVVCMWEFLRLPLERLHVNVVYILFSEDLTTLGHPRTRQEAVSLPLACLQPACLPVCPPASLPVYILVW